MAPSARATPITISDLNSSVTVDPSSAAGMSSWVVDGKNQLNRQWFWFRVGDAGPEHPLNEAVLVGAGSYQRYLAMDYTIGTVQVSISYTLTGGAADSRWSDIAETIRFINTGPTAVQMHFFEYTDFNLAGSADTDTVVVDRNHAYQTGEDQMLSETIVTPRPTHFEAAYAGETLARLNDNNPTTLSDTPGPLSGDVTWAYQWDFTLSALNGTYIISKDKLIDPLPEPITLVTVGLGMALAAVRARRR
jgi:hypothetical protein